MTVPHPLPTRSFYIVRHGETAWNKEGRLQGILDIPLNENGVAQAHLARRFVANTPVTLVASSTLTRASATAAIIVSDRNIRLVQSKTLGEKDYGSFAGKLRNDLRKEFGIPMDQPLTPVLPPDAEQPGATAARICSAIATILAENPNDTVLFVTHAGPIRELCRTLGLPVETQSSNGRPYFIQPQPDGTWTMTVVADDV